MDVVLEVFDAFLFDRAYATLLPAQLSHRDLRIAPNGTFTSAQNQPTAYVYQPASQYLAIEPSKYAYQSAWPRDHLYRQMLSLYIITAFFGVFVYFFFGTLSYIFIFDKTQFNHPRYLKNQMSMEIAQSLRAMPVIALCTVPAFLAEVRGWSKIYDTTAEGPGRWYDIMQFPFFFIFTDSLIYWIHRGLHHPLIYKRLHKSHHKWVVPTPFASHAFHPLDGFAQSVPYHVFPFLFPLQKFAYIALFIFVNIWTVMIHDGEYAMNSKIINGAACHTMHHLYFSFNYGQFTTVWDRIGGSYRKPNEELFRREDKLSKAEWERQSKEMQSIVERVEGKDNDRVYLHPEETKKAQ
ncbi:MAG: hypothetical protein Q9159_001965 [Coniocarpon cinnabarinum]